MAGAPDDVGLRGAWAGEITCDCLATPKELGLDRILNCAGRGPGLPQT